jgi:hypothetical protein
MSGRLIILPKKSYCPWNSKNVERVLRDEREHAEATAKEAKDQEKSASLTRIDALKKNNNKKKRKLELSASGDDSPIERRPQHVNLFALEEAEHQKRLETVMEPSKQQKNHGVVPLYLGQSVNESAFYLKSTPSGTKADEKGEYAVKREEERKDKMDPMRAFFGSSSEKLNSAPNHHHHHHEPMNSTMRSKTTKGGHSRRERRDRAEDKGGSRTHSADASTSSSSSTTTSTSSNDDSSMQRRNRRRHKRSRSKKHGRSRSKSTNGESSIDELRRRRAEREEAERHRQSEVIQASRDVRFSGYQNQYHPGLSRK